MNLGKLRICMDVFRECRIFDYEENEGELAVRLLNCQGKADINGSSVLRALMAMLKG